MTREELEHAIRAAADVTQQNDLVVIGSQAVLGQYPNAPAPLLISREVDIYAPNAPEMSDMIDGALGEYSQFERSFGFFVDGVGPDTAKLPQGWEERLIPVCNANTNGATGWCLEVHDIAVAKYFAGREKDLRYTKDLWESGLIEAATLKARLDTTDLEPERRQRIASAARRHEELHGRPTRKIAKSVLQAALQKQANGNAAARVANTGIENAETARRDEAYRQANTYKPIRKR